MPYSRRNSPHRSLSLQLSVTWLLLLLWPCISSAADFKREVIYQIVTDRFFDGDPSNNDPPQSAGMYDQTRQNWRAYWGGDLEGIRQKLPYLAGMGITAIWISMPADNMNAVIRTSTGRPVSPYYGYQPRDFKRIEEHFGDIQNSWAPFDKLTAAAHEHGIKVIIDLTPNHTSAMQAGEDGALYDNGEFIGRYSSDPSGYFNHFGVIADPYDPFETQFYSLYGRADLNQENPRIDAYLKSSAHLVQQHGVDSFRIDALKHMPWGWLHGFANSIYTNGDSFIFGEWYLDRTNDPPLYWDYAFSNSIYSPDANFSFPQEYRGFINDPLYADAFKLANDSNISLIDFSLKLAIHNVFGKNNADFSAIDSAVSQASEDFSDANSLVTFIDNHDQPRFLSTYNKPERLNLALAFLLTTRGIPCIYYGNEQYLHNDTREGHDPYNRPMMESFSTTTPAYVLISKLSALRRANAAIPYGSMERRWSDRDVYIYERKFSDHVVMVAINKGDAKAEINGLQTSLPAGAYADYLEGKFGGLSINVSNNAAASFTLPDHSVSVWSYISGAGQPQIGSISPRMGQPGMKLKINGDHFGQAMGAVTVGSTRAEVVSWSETEIAVVVPASASGPQQIAVATATGLVSNKTEFKVLTAQLIPVVFTVKDTSRTLSTDRIFLSGNVTEMGAWNATWRDALGPFATRNGRDWTMCASLPAGQTIQFRLFRISDGGGVRWASNDVQVYTVPTTGVGRVDLEWSD